LIDRGTIISGSEAGCGTGVLHAPDTTRCCPSVHAPYGSQQAAVFL